MRIWDINPGYLDNRHLLSEHRDLHRITFNLRQNKRGYSENLQISRWQGYGWALKQRHSLVEAEMKLRGYNHNSPVLLRTSPGSWPDQSVYSYQEQLVILDHKYNSNHRGRIPLPANAQVLWAQHKYSVMARDISIYKALGVRVASKHGQAVFNDLATELNSLLQSPPSPKLIENALLHMWGYVSAYMDSSSGNPPLRTQSKLLNVIQQLSIKHRVKYMLESTALGELCAWK